MTEDDAAAESHTVTVEATTIEDVTQALFSDIMGSATCVFEVDGLTLSGTNVFRNNSATDFFGGAFYWTVGANTTIDLSTVTFEGNSASLGGGAVRIGTASVAGSPDPIGRHGHVHLRHSV